MVNTSPTCALRSRRCFGWPRWLATCFAAWLLAGCSIIPKPTEDPTRYYVLTAEPASVETASAPPSGSVRLGMKPLELPGYLHNNRTLVVRDGVNEIRYEEYARWAEPLDLGLRRIMKDRWLAQGGVSAVYDPPFLTGERRDYDISVRIQQCEGGATGTGGKTRTVARFSADYEIAGTNGSNPVLVRKHFTAPDAAWDGKDFGVLVRLLSDDAVKLADEIIANLPR